MKIGIISLAYPFPLETNVYGGFKRMGIFIQAMQEIGELDILYYVNPDFDIDFRFIAEKEEELGTLWNTKLRLDLCKLAPDKIAKGRYQEYISPALSIVKQHRYMQVSQEQQIDAVHRMLSRKPDILFVHRLVAMIPYLLTKGKHPRIYFDLDDIEHVSFLRSIKQPPWWPGKRLYYLRLPILKLWERRAILGSHTTFICSEHDRKYLSSVYGCNNVAVIPNAIEIPIERELPNKPNFLFLGRMSYPPNTVAADFLIKEIWPIIYKEIPNAKLLIAGSKPEKIESFKDNPPGVEFLGFIDNLEELYKEVAIVCCPILSGGGTRIKILEAAAYGKPVVSTTIGAEGLDLRDGNEILIGDDPGSFAAACIRLIKDRDLAVNIGQAARLFVSREHCRNKVVDIIRNHINQLELDARP